MKKTLVLIALIAFTGCATYVPYGGLYTEGKMGLQDNGGSSDKTGRACMKSILGLVATGDGSIDAAKRAGGISKVATIDYQVNNILGIVGEYCTVVTGS